MRKFLFGSLFVLLIVFAYSFKRTPRPYTFPKLFNFPAMPSAQDNPVSEEGVELGRYLFYDTILSADGKLSCASCHKQEYAFSDAPNKVSKGFNQIHTRRNAPPLFNLAWNQRFFWDGKAASLEEQVLHPVRDTNELRIGWKEAVRRISANTFYAKKFQFVFGTARVDSILVAKAIAQFLRALISHRSKYDLAIQRKIEMTLDERKGFVIANDQALGGCLHCHPTDAIALGTTGEFSNNGLDSCRKVSDYADKGLGAVTGNQKDVGLFKIPSLRNIALTAPYMHDGRFKTLEEVVDFYSEGLNMCVNVDSKLFHARQHGTHFSAEQKKQLIAFLNTLTDTAFVKDPRFSNPFLKNKKR